MALYKEKRNNCYIRQVTGPIVTLHREKVRGLRWTFIFQFDLMYTCTVYRWFFTVHWSSFIQIHFLGKLGLKIDFLFGRISKLLKTLIVVKKFFIIVNSLKNNFWNNLFTFVVKGASKFPKPKPGGKKF